MINFYGVLFLLGMTVLMSFLARTAGGGLGAHLLNKKGATDEQGKDKGGIMPVNLGRLPEFLFAIVIGLCTLNDFNWLGVIAATLWSYWWMETGHGVAFAMGYDPATAQSGRKNTLSVVVDPICKAVGAPLGGRFFCWLFMGIKGLLIGLPLGFDALYFALFWPAAYGLGWELNRLKIIRMSGTEFGEYATGALAGLVAGLHTFR